MDLRERLSRHIEYKKRYLALCSKWRIKYGQYMQRERESCGLSLREMAKRVGSSSSTIFAIEQGSTYCTPKIAERYLSEVEKAKKESAPVQIPGAGEEQNGVPAQS